MPSACDAAPRSDCREPGAVALAIKERRAGRERLAFAARRFAAGLAREDLGDPVGGQTAYRLCVYDGAGRLVGHLAVDRAGTLCGPDDRPCWTTVGTTGYLYRDRTSAADGVKRLLVKGGRAGKGTVRLIARNKAQKGLTSLPTGFTVALEGAERATAQLVGSDAGCVGATLERVKRADGTAFTAKTSRPAD